MSNRLKIWGHSRNLRDWFWQMVAAAIICGGMALITGEWGKYTFVCIAIVPLSLLFFQITKGRNKTSEENNEN